MKNHSELDHELAVIARVTRRTLHTIFITVPVAIICIVTVAIILGWFLP